MATVSDILRLRYTEGLIGQSHPSVQFKKEYIRISLVVQWLRLHSPNAGGTGSIPGEETKIPYATQHDQKERKSVPEIRTAQWKRGYFTPPWGALHRRWPCWSWKQEEIPESCMQCPLKEPIALRLPNSLNPQICNHRPRPKQFHPHSASGPPSFFPRVCSGVPYRRGQAGVVWKELGEASESIWCPDQCGWSQQGKAFRQPAWATPEHP